MYGLDMQFIGVVTSQRFGGYADVEAMGIDGFVSALAWLDIAERHAPKGGR